MYGNRGFRCGSLYYESRFPELARTNHESTKRVLAKIGKHIYFLAGCVCCPDRETNG
jgi:hypothetical protein